MDTHLVLDIETIPDPDFPRDDPDKVPSAPQNRIITIGCMLLEEHKPTRLGVVGEGKDERAILFDLVAWIEKAKPTIVTWNGRGFDLPVITSRALKYGASMPWWFHDRNTRYRFSVEGHFDLMDFLSDFGASRNAKLDVFAKLCGFPGKVGVDGSLVAPMFAAGEIQEINAYCLCDVAQTAAVFLRVQLLRGIVDKAKYRTLAEQFLTFVDAEPRLLPLAEKIDRNRFVEGG